MRLLSALLPLALALLAAVPAAAPVHAQGEPVRTDTRPLPHLIQKNGRFALLVDDAPFLVMGIEDLTMGDWPTRANVWNALEYMQVNTVEIAVYWQDFEPQPGRYDYAVIDRLLAEAREHQVRLVPLWFGSYKNGRPHYMPDWMKLDPARYAHALDKNGQAVDSPSPFATASLEADQRAFAALLTHLKAVDPQRTVIMVQVENETGNWNSVRDYSPAAQQQFKAPVPPEILKAMHVATGSPAPDWDQAFGPDAEEYFNAWAVARYVGQVAAAGKAVYPLPMVANAALRDPFHPGPPGVRGAPGAYESGGPTDNVLDIWKAAAPAVDILGPDVYQRDPAAYLKVLELYHRHDNPLYLPETGCTDCARFFFAGLGLQSIGFSPATDVTRPALLGTQAGMAAQSGDPGAWVDYKPVDEFLTSWGMNYRLIGPMQREIARLNFEGKLQAMAEPRDKGTGIMAFGPWNAEVTWGTRTGGSNPPAENPRPVGRALVAELGANEFLVTGYYCRVDFRPAGSEQQRRAQQVVPGTDEVPSALIEGRWQHRQFLRVEQVVWDNGAFRRVRTWAGRAGETNGLYFGEEPVVLRVSLATY